MVFNSEIRAEISNREGILEAFFALIKLVVPSAIGTMFVFLPQMITTMYVGQRLGVHGLAVFASALATFNVCAMSIGTGLATALASLGSRAYGRDKENPEIGELAQKAWLVNFALSIPCVIFFVTCEPFLEIGFGKEIASEAQRALIHSTPFLLIQFVTQPMRRVINCSRQTQLPLVGNIVSTSIIFVIGYFYVQDDVAQAMHLLAFGALGACSVFIYFLNTHKNLGGFRKAKWPMHDSLFDRQELIMYLKVAIAAMCAVCAEWWAFEGQMFMAGRVGPEAVAVLSVVFGIFITMISPYSGLVGCTGTAIGNALGANDGHLARATLIAGFATLFAFQSVTAPFIMYMGGDLWKLWTHDEAVLKYATKMTPIIVMCHFCDGWQFMYGAVFAGAGKQAQCAKVVLCSLWGVGMPASYFLSDYFGFGIYGVVGGLLMGLFCEVPLMTYASYQWNWLELAEKASKGKKKGKNNKEEEDSERPAQEEEEQRLDDDLHLELPVNKPLDDVSP